MSNSKQLSVSSLKRAIFVLILIAVFFQTIQSVQYANSLESSVDVRFDILTGSGLNEYYVGDYFTYNITILNSGDTIINAEFTVEVRDSNGSILGSSKYQRSLQPSQTTFLFPNFTRNNKKEYRIYPFDITGTHSLRLYSNASLLYYRRFPDGKYTWTSDSIKFPFDVMPSYEKEQNERWNEFLQKNEDYMEEVQRYLKQSILETNITRLLAIAGLLSSIISGTFAYKGLKQKGRGEKVLYYGLMVILVLVAAFTVLFALLGL